MMVRLILVLPYILLIFPITAQSTDCVLKKEKEGIKVYTVNPTPVNSVHCKLNL